MSAFDYAVIAIYVIVVLWIGYASSRGHSSSSSLLLGDRSLPTWAVLCSMIATELSAATFIGVPHAGYSGSWSYLEFAFGALAGKGILAVLVIPLYHRLGIVTVYGLLQIHFGPGTRFASALAFVAGRILASGVRLFIAALAFSTVTQQPIEVAIVLCGAIAIAYTWMGGIRSVIWTDVLQGFVFILSALALLWVLDGRAPGGLAEIWSWGSTTARTEIFEFDPLFSLTSTLPFGTAFLGGFVLTLATHATDHDMVQRLLATRDGRSGGRALLASGLINFPLSLLFLFIGTGIAFAYATAPGYDISDSARILPLFALHELPPGVRGLVFAGLFAAAMSSLDSATCAIASTWVSDIAPRREDGPDLDDRALTRQIRRISLIAGALLVGAALAMSSYHGHVQRSGGGLSLVEFALSSMTILYGGLLGVFARAILLRTPARDGLGVLGLAVGGGIGLLLFLHPLLLGETRIAWTWWIPISATASFAISAIPASRDIEATTTGRD